MRLSPKALALNAAVITALVGGTTAYAALDTDVTLTVDGESESVSSFGRTVGDVLESEGIELGENDLVVPSVSSPIQDGSEIAVRYGRLLSVTVDGTEREVWTTALSVEEALSELGIRADAAKLSVSRSAGIGRDGLDLEVLTPKDVTIKVAGTTEQAEVTALTVRQAIAQAGVSLSPQDRVSPAKTAEVEDGTTITVTRVRVEPGARTVEIDHDTVRKESGSLYKGQSKVQTAGRDGAKSQELRRVYVDGRWERTDVLSEQVVRRPVAEVVLVGTKERPAPAPEPRTSRSSSRTSTGGSSAPSVPSGSVWDALANCESGGNWSINTGNGYYGGLQFSIGTWQAYGGSGMPHQNSREEQIRIATKVRDARGGYGDWPACSSKLGLPR